MSERLRTYAEFWPFYLREHSKPVTRWLHFVGTTVGLGFCVSAFILGRGALALGFPLFGYGMAWIGHFGVEKNRPATFKYPLWSLISDFRMLGLMAVGQLGPHLERAEAGRPASGGGTAQAAPSR
jgi:hypothetical protein